MNGVGFLKSFDACVGHANGKIVFDENYKGYNIKIIKYPKEGAFSEYFDVQVFDGGRLIGGIAKPDFSTAKEYGKKLAETDAIRKK